MIRVLTMYMYSTNILDDTWIKLYIWQRWASSYMVIYVQCFRVFPWIAHLKKLLYLIMRYRSECSHAYLYWLWAGFFVVIFNWPLSPVYPYMRYTSSFYLFHVIPFCLCRRFWKLLKRTRRARDELAGPNKSGRPNWSRSDITVSWAQCVNYTLTMSAELNSCQLFSKQQLNAAVRCAKNASNRTVAVCLWQTEWFWRHQHARMSTDRVKRVRRNRKQLSSGFRDKVQFLIQAQMVIYIVISSEMDDLHTWMTFTHGWPSHGWPLHMDDLHTWMTFTLGWPSHGWPLHMDDLHTWMTFIHG